MRASLGLFVFLALFIGAWTGLHYYVYLNLLAAGFPRGPLIGLIWVLALAFPMSRFGALRLHGAVIRGLNWLGSAWMGLGFLLAFWFFAASLARRGLVLAGLEAWAQPRPWILGTAAAVIALGARGLVRALGGPREVRYRVDRTARYGMGREARIVQISDVHLGLILGTDYLRALVDRINALEADLVLITGDFIDPEFPDDAGAAEQLRRIRARDGVFAVSGNHEFYAGIGRFLRLMERAGVAVLANESRVTASGLQVAGIHDQTAGRMPAAAISCDLGRALSQLDPGLPSVLMAHQPKELEPAAEKRVDLVLSGHTHAGQIFPFHAMVRIAFRYLGGRHRIGPDTDLIVCAGTGFWGPPLRVGTHSQLVVVTLAY